MADQLKRTDPLYNNHFMLRVEAYKDVPCKSISGFTKENEYEYIQEGGLNDYVHMRRKSISKPATFQVERYIGIDDSDPLPSGSEFMLPLLLLVSKYANNFNNPERVYVFTGCVVTAKEYGTLTAEQSGILVEKTTIAYHDLLVVDNPFDGEKEPWAMNLEKPVAKKYSRYNDGEVRLSEMKSNARRWPDISSQKAITGNQNIKANNRLWPETSSRKSVDGYIKLDI